VEGKLFTCQGGHVIALSLSLGGESREREVKCGSLWKKKLKDTKDEERKSLQAPF